MNRLNRLIPLFALAFFAGCSTAGTGTDGGTSKPSPEACAMFEAVIAPRRAAYVAKCANAVDPLTDDKCLILDGINLAIEGCWASAGGRPVVAP